MGADVFDHTDRLGFLKMPPGYRLLQLDSGHFIYERIIDERESPIHWNKWVVRQWAWLDHIGSSATHTTPKEPDNG